MTEHTPSNLPKVTLNGSDYYIRSDSLSVDNKEKVWTDRSSLTAKWRRAVATKPKSWSMTLALRSTAERDAIRDLINSMSYQTYTFNFDDGMSDFSGTVGFGEVGEFTPVVDNTDFWDIEVTLKEWL